MDPDETPIRLRCAQHETLDVDARRTVVVGSDRLGQRIAEQLRRDECGVVVLAIAGSHLAGVASRPDLVVASALMAEPETLQAVGVLQAEALFAATDDDELNLAIGLAAREMNPRIRLVLRQFNVRLGGFLAQHLPESVVLSLSALTAPTFAVAALTPGVVFAHRVGEEFLVLREVAAGSVDESPLLAAHGPSGLRWFPKRADVEAGATVLVAGLGRDLPPHLPRSGTPVAPLQTPRAPANRLLLYTLAALCAALALATAFFHLRMGIAPLDAFYFAATIMSTVGFGDYNLRDENGLSKLFGVGLMFSGVVLGAVLVALITNALVERQAALARGRFRWRLRGHAVVCGLGSIGLRIAEVLRDLGQDVVVIEPDEDGRFVAAARAGGFKLVIGDATHEDSLVFANVAEARALVAATSSDHRNLEIALTARSLAPSVPLVLRMFDPDLSRRVAAAFDIEATFSGATLGAGRFTAFAVDGTRLAALRFRGEPYGLHQVLGAAGETVAACAARVGGRAIALVEGNGHLAFHPLPERRVEERESVLVLAYSSRPTG